MLSHADAELPRDRKVKDVERVAVPSEEGEHGMREGTRGGARTRKHERREKRSERERQCAQTGDLHKVVER